MIGKAPARDTGLPPFPVERWTLANGLRVVVQVDRRWPLMASMMCYDAGSRWNRIARSGLAHLCEHLAFHGPRQASGCSYADRIEISGGSPQAVTTADRMSFAAVFPSGHFRAVLAVEAERMARPLDPHDAEALAIERQVLLEELRERSESRLRAAQFEHIHRSLYPEGHSYHCPPAGQPDGIRAISTDDIEAFVTSRFTPRNAVLVLVGDVSVADAVSEVRRGFETLPAGGERVPPAAWAVQSRREERPVRVVAGAGRTHAHVAWSVPGFGQQGWYLAALLKRSLTGGQASPLARELIDVGGVRGSLITMRDSSTLVFGATAARGVGSTRLQQRLFDATSGLLSLGVSETGLECARKKALSDHYIAAESFERRADLCASFACYLDEPERLEREPARYLAPDREAIAAFASALRQVAVGARLSPIAAVDTP